jgi:hypothetical protein
VEDDPETAEVAPDGKNKKGNNKKQKKKKTQVQQFISSKVYSKHNLVLEFIS